MTKLNFGGAGGPYRFQRYDGSYPIGGGVYAFVKADGGEYFVQYIGKSQDMPERFDHHERWPEAVASGVNMVFILQCDEPLRSQVERATVDKYNPSMNKVRPPAPQFTSPIKPRTPGLEPMRRQDLPSLNFRLALKDALIGPPIARSLRQLIEESARKKS